MTTRTTTVLSLSPRKRRRRPLRSLRRRKRRKRSAASRRRTASKPKKSNSWENVRSSLVYVFLPCFSSFFIVSDPIDFGDVDLGGAILSDDDMEIAPAAPNEAVPQEAAPQDIINSSKRYFSRSLFQNLICLFYCLKSALLARSQLCCRVISADAAAVDAEEEQARSVYLLI